MMTLNGIYSHTSTQVERKIYNNSNSNLENEMKKNKAKKNARNISNV